MIITFLFQNRLKDENVLKDDIFGEQKISLTSIIEADRSNPCNLDSI